MPTLFRPPKALAVLSFPVSTYVEATNSFDLEGLVATFADDALVNDHCATIGVNRRLKNGRRATSSARADHVGT
jgi:hypothetical protein